MPENKDDSGMVYERVNRPLGKMLLHNFLGGIAWSLGTLLGASIIIGIIGYIIAQIDFVPIIGKWVADIIQSSQSNLSQ
jgi:hypothetical protein